jgi:hypothetical protein
VDRSTGQLNPIRFTILSRNGDFDSFAQFANGIKLIDNGLFPYLQQILGPLLFLIFINDLPAYLTESGCKLFADDTTIECAGESIEQVSSRMRKVCEKLIEWCD